MARSVVISGSSGLIGSALAARLVESGWEVRRLVRRSPRGGNEYRWDVHAGEVDERAFHGATAVVNLAGEYIGRRWTAARRQEIRSSRIAATTLIVRAIERAAAPPAVLVSASASGFYGDRGDEVLDESSASGDGTLAALCRDWEAAAAPAAARGTRVVNLRTGGVVLARHGGALPRLLFPFRLGLGGRIGDGRQWMSWITLEDETRVIEYVLDADSIHGPVNSCAPAPVTNRELTAVLGRVLRRPTLFPVPAFVLRLVFGEMADETILASQRTVPRLLESKGFRFQAPEIEDALRQVLAAPR